MSRLNDLLRQLEAKEPALARELRTEYDALADRRAFGLNFERHVPESVELPGRPIRKGDKVHLLSKRGTNPTAENSRLWRVLAVDRSAATATIEDASVDPVETQEQPLTELVAVAELRDPIYPGLVSTGRIERGGDTPFHTVINAENFHALQTLLFTHRGQVDCIYIDPPYNTGNEGWIYNDKYVAGDDHYKHSKWLAFMERRLLIARELLKPTGVLIVAIGDEEHHRLRMLLDDVFGADNYLGNVGWVGGRKNDARFISPGTDFMLFYGSSVRHLVEGDVRWRESKPGFEEVVAAGRAAWDESGCDASRATELFRKWWRDLPKDHIARTDPGLKNSNRVDDVRPGAVFQSSDLGSPNPRPNLMYEVLHPETGRPVPMNANGWRLAKPVMQAYIAEGRILFGTDESAVPRFKRYLEDVATIVPVAMFSKERQASSKHLQAVLGDQRFPFTKDHEVLSRWLRIVLPDKDAVVLDFFGGSGSTTEAVMRMNAQDRGTRRCILVTNNEASASDARQLRRAGHRPGDPSWEAAGVFEHVAVPRISTVVTGAREDGSTYSEGLDQNVEFFKLTYEAPLRVSSNREFPRIAPLLWMKAGSQGRRIDDISVGWGVADTYAVLADLDQTEAFLKAVAQREEDGTELRMVFVVTDEDRLFTSVCRELPAHVEAVRLYEAYLRNFEIEAGRSAR